MEAGLIPFLCIFSQTLLQYNAIFALGQCPFHCLADSTAIAHFCCIFPYIFVCEIPHLLTELLSLKALLSRWTPSCWLGHQGRVGGEYLLPPSRTNPIRVFIRNLVWRSSWWFYQVGLRLALAGTLPEVDTCVTDWLVSSISLSWLCWGWCWSPWLCWGWVSRRTTLATRTSRMDLSHGMPPLRVCSTPLSGFTFLPWSHHHITPTLLRVRNAHHSCHPSVRVQEHQPSHLWAIFGRTKHAQWKQQLLLRINLLFQVNNILHFTKPQANYSRDDEKCVEGISIYQSPFNNTVL